MRWPRTGENGSIYVNASLISVKTPKVHPIPTLDFHTHAHVDAFSTARATSHDTVVSVTAHNIVVHRVAPPSTVVVEEASEDVETLPDIHDTANPKNPDL